MSYYILLLNELSLVDDVIKIIKEYYYLYTFPRMQGFCIYHYIPDGVTKFKGLSCATEKQKEIVIHYLKGKLISGDMVHLYAKHTNVDFNTYLYDGKELISFVERDDYKKIYDLMKTKTKLGLNIPFNYWRLTYVYFDIEPFLTSCYENLSCDDEYVYTTFTYNSNLFTIRRIHDVMNRDIILNDVTINNYKRNFMEILSISEQFISIDHYKHILYIPYALQKNDKL